MTRHRIVVCYDISNNRVRQHFVKILNKYGTRLQKSIYEFYITKSMAQSMRKEIADFYFRAVSAKKHKEGKSLNILMIPICEECFKSKVTHGQDFNEHSKNIIL